MKKLTTKQIIKKFKKITNQLFVYNETKNIIALNGNFASDELREIAKTMDECFHGTPEEQEITRIKNLNVNGFTAKDVRVLWYNHGDDIAYSFVLVKDGMEYDFYYGVTGDGNRAGDWWPESADQMSLSPIFLFVPNGFSEACENIYHYNDTLKNALKLFKKLGFSTARSEDL